MRVSSCSIACCEITYVAAARTASAPNEIVCFPKVWRSGSLFTAAAIFVAIVSPPSVALAATVGTSAAQPVFVFGIPVDFILFGLTLLGVALFHHEPLQVALSGLAAAVVYHFLFTGIRAGAGFSDGSRTGSGWTFHQLT